MDAKMQLWMLMTLMSVSVYQFTDCCSCPPYHAQKAFCDSDLVIKAKFLKDSSTNMYSEYFGNYSLIEYEIETLQVFKGGPEIKNLKFIYSSTEYYCGYYVSPSSEEYLITGPWQNSRVDVNLCNYIVPWRTLSDAQKKGIEGAYNCDCKICFQWECGEDPTYNCPWDIYIDSLQDELKDKMCALNVNDECIWHPVAT